MSWKDKLQTASFRGVEFGVKDASFTGGRRSVIHEFPQKDIPYTQDMGRKAKEFSISAFVVDEDYFGNRDELINALDKKGPGELVHPYYGKIKVQCTGFSVRESFDNGGMAEFSITFSQTEKIQFNNVESPNGIAIGEAIILDAFNFSNDLFIPNFDTSGISFVLDSVVGMARGLNKLANRLLSPLASIAGVLDDVSSAFNNVALETRVLATKPLSLINAFQNPFKKIIGGLGQLDRIGASYSRLNTGDRKIDTSRLLAIKYAMKLFNAVKLESTLTKGNTDSNTRVNKNDRAMKMAYRVGAIAVAADSLLTAPYDTNEDALADKELVMDAIEELLTDIETFPDHEELFKSLKDLKIHLSKYVPGDGASKRSISTIEFPNILNSLQASYSIYGNLDNEDNLIFRNKIRNPAIISGMDGVKYVN